ncbi:class I SAM-dependent methyltransferase [uncultured Desulfobacter sp.]|uniref:class I SAM-dependent methyltransferase n=1 Tax=uncultured Desulfobacter sp. TaxID=240139 RepID=UPI002AA63885|nr:class I SAM-dependent methyltransferase [uncultured Desulfobacter sp.]
MDIYSFYLMCFWFSLRDALTPPIKKLKSAGLKKGLSVLDYGCGPGSFSLAASLQVGETGTVYAVDQFPAAIEMIRRKAAKRKLKNVTPILTECYTGLPDESIDIVILHDVFHELINAQKVMDELYRVMKPDAVLWFNDHHMDIPTIEHAIQANHRFKLERHDRSSLIFKKCDPGKTPV